MMPKTLTKPGLPISASGEHDLSWVMLGLDFLVVMVLLGPIIGVLNPPEGFFNLNANFSIAGGSAPVDYPATTAISRIIHLLVLVLLIRNWRHYLIEFRLGT